MRKLSALILLCVAASAFAQAITGSGGGSSLPTPVAIASGGTAATTASAALASLGAAASGNNSDITALAGPALGTPASGVATNLTGTASGLTAGHVTTNASLTGPITSTGNATAIGAQTGTGSTFVMQASPTLTTPNLGTPSAVVLTNATGSAAGLTAGAVTTNANLTGPITSVGNTTAVAAQTGTGSTFVMQAGPTFTGTVNDAGRVTTSVSATAEAVGPAGTTNPTLNIDASTASAATGLNIKSAAAGGGMAVSVLSSGTNENLAIDAKGSGTVTIGAASTGNVVISRTMTTAAITSSSSIRSTNNGSGLGYATGAGGTVTQSGSRATGVTLSKITGAITLVSAAGSASFQTFTVTNTAIAATDVVIVNQKSGADKYQIFVTNVTAGTFDITFATTGGTTTEQPVFSFAIIKGVTA